MNTHVLAWHFVGDTLRDGNPIPANGAPLVYSDPLVLCQSGLHASIDPFDALQYAPGPVLCRVRCSGIGAREAAWAAARSEFNQLVKEALYGCE